MSKGYDNIPALFQTILDIPMIEGAGLAGAFVDDMARGNAYNHTMTLRGPPAWVQTGLSNTTILSFNPGNPDFLEASDINTDDLDFTVSAFSMAAWIYEDNQAVDRYILERGLANTDGWVFHVDSNGALRLATFQTPAANQFSASANGAIPLGTWKFVGATRLGASARIFINGVDVTAIVGNHIHPTTSPRKFHVGIDDTEATMPWDGYIYRPIIWNRQISAFEMLSLFNMSRGLFGV